MKVQKQHILMVILSIVTGLFSACSNSTEDQVNTSNGSSSAEMKTDRKDDVATNQVSASVAGDGDRGGYDLVSAAIPFGCVGYKIADHVLVTTATCLADCVRENCELAVLSVNAEVSYLGLSNKVAISTTKTAEVGQALGLVYLENNNGIPIKPIIEQADSLSMLNYERKLDYIEDTVGYLAASEQPCPNASVAITDSYGNLFGISMSMQGNCDEFLYLNAFYDFVREALNPDYQPTSLETDPAAELEARREQEEREEAEREREELEAYWAEKEVEALQRASNCDSSEESYCDGEVEMRCSGGTFQAMHCGRVGWYCNSESSWGPSCEPRN